MKAVSGMTYAYFFICRRKMWCFSRGITLEEGNEDVAIGKLIDENSYGDEKKHILVDDYVNIDFMKDQTVFEIKKSKRERTAALSQIKYYLYVLNKKGINDLTGELRVPKENYIEKVVPIQQDYDEIERNLAAIEEILVAEKPPAAEHKNICKKCAYYDLCYI